MQNKKNHELPCNMTIQEKVNKVLHTLNYVTEKDGALAVEIISIVGTILTMSEMVSQGGSNVK